jgi:DNA-binding response OmpR family regulator
MKEMDFWETNMKLKTKILAVSRDRILVNLLHRGLNDGDFEIVSTEQSGNGLKDIVESEHPAFIILDIVMPSLDGVGTCLQLRQWTQSPIMLLSTWNTSNDMVRGLNLACDSYLTEPFGIATLKTRIEYTLKHPSIRVMDNIKVSNN